MSYSALTQFTLTSKVISNSTAPYYYLLHPDRDDFHSHTLSSRLSALVRDLLEKKTV